MKENLFFRATRSTVKRRAFQLLFLNLIMLPLLCISPFFSATALRSDEPPQDQQATIYVSENTLVYGLSNMTNAKVVIIPGKTTSKKIVEPTKKNQTFEKQAVAKKDNKNEELRILQQKINKKIKNIFYSSSQDSDLLRFANVKIATVATFNSSSSKYQKAIVSIDEDLNIFKIQNREQKFFTSLSYSEFQKLRNSFLRGPPQLV